MKFWKKSWEAPLYMCFVLVLLNITFFPAFLINMIITTNYKVSSLAFTEILREIMDD